MEGFSLSIESILAESVRMGASDTHITVGLPPMIRVDGMLMPLGNQPLTAADTEYLCKSMIDKSRQQYLNERGEIDFSYIVENFSRFRCNVFKQRGTYALAARTITNEIPTCEQLGLPNIFKDLVMRPRGLILVTGPTGSGKSTTLAAMINEINNTKPVHILTIEDPIEYVYVQNMATIRQREVGSDVKDFNAALRSALREDPDIILVGEMRDYETISLALTAAETGHLVMGTLHTTSAPQTIDRIIDACPPHAQAQVRTMLSTTLRGVISQCLVPLAAGNGRVAATEVLIGTDAAMNLVRTEKCHQLVSTMQMGKAQGMHTLNSDLARLVREGLITKEMALNHSTNKGELSQTLGDPSMMF